MIINSKDSLQKFFKNQPSVKDTVALLKKSRYDFRNDAPESYRLAEDRLRQFLDGRLPIYQTTPAKMNALFRELDETYRCHSANHLGEIEKMIMDIVSKMGYLKYSLILTLQENSIQSIQSDGDRELISLIKGRIEKNPHVPLALVLNPHALRAISDARLMAIGVPVKKSMHFPNLSKFFDTFDDDLVLASLEPLIGKGHATVANPKVINLSMFDWAWQSGRDLSVAIKQSKLKIGISDESPYRHK